MKRPYLTKFDQRFGRRPLWKEPEMWAWLALLLPAAVLLGMAAWLFLQ